jgi:uncharacterized protein YjbJ (UPF0337 family)
MSDSRNNYAGTAIMTRLFFSVAHKWSMTMDKQRIEGGLKKATGTIKEKAGQVTGDRDLEAEGTVEKGEGHIRSGIGKAKDAVKEIVGKD